MNLLKSGGKGMIWKIWVWKLVCAKFWDSELERLSILSRNQLEGTLGRPFKPGAIFCHFLIWINRPHPTHHSTMGMWEGVASVFLSFSGNAMGGRVGDSYRASAVKAWGLVILLCRGNPILRDATTPETQPATKNSNISDWQKIIFGDLNRKLLGWKKKGKFEQVLRCFQLFRLLEFSCVISFFECVSLFERASPNNLHTNGV